MKRVSEPSSEANDDSIVKHEGLLNEKKSENKYFQEVWQVWKENTGICLSLTNKTKLPWRRTSTNYKSSQSLEDKATGDVPKSNHQDQITSQEESDDIENDHVAKKKVISEK